MQSTKSGAGLQVIDYGYENIFGLVNCSYTTYELKIDDIEFKLDSTNSSTKSFAEVTLNSMPKVILKKIRHSSVKIGYSLVEPNPFPDEIIEIDRYEELRKELDTRIYDDDDEYKIWNTVEEKVKYDEFIAKWKPVYKEVPDEWVPIEFEVVCKQFIPEKYRHYISSNLIIHTNGNDKKYKAICNYKTDPYSMLISIARELGFEITDNEYKTEGKKLYTKWKDSDCLRWSKVNGNYIKLDSIRDKYRNFAGTFEECVAKYQWEYDQIYNYLLGIKNTLDNPGISSSDRQVLNDRIDQALSRWYNVESYSKTRSEYRNLGVILNDIKSILTKINVSSE